MIGAGWTQGALRAKAGLERRDLRVAEIFFGNSGFSVKKKCLIWRDFRKFRGLTFLPLLLISHCSLWLPGLAEDFPTVKLMGKPGLLEEGVHGLLNWKLPTTEAHKIFFCVLDLFLWGFTRFGTKNPPKNVSHQSIFKNWFWTCFRFSWRRTKYYGVAQHNPKMCGVCCD